MPRIIHVLRLGGFNPFQSGIRSNAHVYMSMAFTASGINARKLPAQLRPVGDGSATYTCSSISMHTSSDSDGMRVVDGAGHTLSVSALTGAEWADHNN